MSEAGMILADILTIDRPETTMPQDDHAASRKRERSHRYPGRSLAESLELAAFVEERGLDGFPAGEIARALGYTSVKTNTFSARLSAARQFGLIVLKDEAYSLTPLSRAILHPVDEAELPALRRKSLWESPLYAELAERFRGKTVPDAPILANLLYHQFGIIASAKDGAAATFLESAKGVGVLGADGVLRPDGAEAARAVVPVEQAATKPRAKTVRLDLPLWGEDAGKTIRVRAPESLTRASYERLLGALQLLLRVEG